MFDPNYDFCEKTWFGSSEQVTQYIKMKERDNEELNYVVSDKCSYPQYELLPLELKPQDVNDIEYTTEPCKKKKKRKKHYGRKRLLQDEVILSGLQTVIDLCGLLDKCDLYADKSGKTNCMQRRTNTDSEVDKSRSHMSCNCQRSVSIKINNLSPYHTVLAHVPQKRLQHSETSTPLNKSGSSKTTKVIDKASTSSKLSTGSPVCSIDYIPSVKNRSPMFQNITAYACGSSDKKQSDSSMHSHKQSMCSTDSTKSGKDAKQKDSKDKKNTKSGSNLSISCIPPVQVPPCDISCSECKAFEKMMDKYTKQHKACECNILKCKKGMSKSECMRDNPTRLFVPGRSCSENQGFVLRKNINVRRSRQSIPLVQPVLGVCSEAECSPFGRLEKVLSVKYAYVKITEFPCYLTYEVMKGSPKKPSYMPSLIRELFVTRKSDKRDKEERNNKKKQKKRDDQKATESNTSNKSNKGNRVNFSNEACNSKSHKR